jgi:cytochrome P450
MLDGKITNAPHISRLAAFRDSQDMIKNPVQVFEKYRTKLGPTFTFHFGGTKPTIVSADPRFIQHVLKDNHANYHKSDIQVKRMVEFQGIGLLNSHGEYWYKQRRLLSQGFSRSHLIKLLPIQFQALEDFMQGFDAVARQGPVDIYNQMVKYTLRLVGKSLFGNMMKDEELDQIGNTISEIQAFMIKQIIQPYKIPWFKISGQSKRYQHMRLAADQIVRNHIDLRNRDEGSNDLLHLLMQTPYKDTGKVMSDEQITTEILQLLVAGNETSSNTLAWTFYLLAKNPESINNIRKEIDSIFGSNKVDFEGLFKLEYSLRVLYEAMRLYPPFWTIDRVALEEDEICGIQIPAGITVMPYIYGAHRNLDFWQTPEEFNPDRFDKIMTEKRHPFAHIPFGGGPRVCIGQNMALMQILLILVTIVRKYNFRLSSSEDVDIQPMLILRPKGEIKMSFELVSP